MKSSNSPLKKNVLKPKGSRSPLKAGVTKTSAPKRSGRAARSRARTAMATSSGGSPLMGGAAPLPPMVIVPNFAGLSLLEANLLATNRTLVLDCYNTSRQRISTPPRDEWDNWMVTSNYDLTLIGTQVPPGTHVGIIIS